MKYPQEAFDEGFKWKKIIEAKGSSLTGLWPNEQQEEFKKFYNKYSALLFDDKNCTLSSDIQNAWLEYLKEKK